MAEDSRLRVEITAESSELKSGMDEASAAAAKSMEAMQGAFSSAGSVISSAVSSMQGAMGSLSGGIGNMGSEIASVTGFFNPLTKAIMEVTAAAGGMTALFKAASAEEEKWVKDSLSLARGFGITTEEASALKLAVEDISATYLTGEASSETLLNAFKRFAMQIAQNEAMLNAWGITTRTTNGEMLNSFDLFMQAVKHLQSLHGMTAITADATKLFGRNITELIPVLMHLSQDGLDEARKKADKLGITVGPEMLAKVQASSMASQHLHEQWQAMSATIASVAIPVWTTMKEVMGQIFELANKIASALSKVIDVFEKLGAAEAEADAQTWGGIGGPAQKGVPVAPPLSTTHEQSGGAPSDRGAGTAAPSRMEEWREALEQMREASGNYFQQDLEAEKTFWEKKLALCAKGSNDYLAVQHQIYSLNKEEAKQGLDAQMADLRAQETNTSTAWSARIDAASAMVDLMGRTYGVDSANYIKALQEKQKLFEQYVAEGQKQLDAEIAERDKAAKEEVEIQAKDVQAEIKLNEDAAKSRQKTLQFDLEMGNITAAQKLAAEVASENDRYAKEQELLAKLIGIWERYPKEFKAVLDQMTLAAQQHNEKVVEDSQKTALQQKKDWQGIATEVGGPVKNAFNTVFDGLMKNGQSFQQTMVKALDAVVEGFEKLIAQIIEAIAEQMILNALTGGTAAAPGMAGTIGSALGLFGGGGGTISLAQGGIVSAMGGFVVPGSAIPALLHPNEMVLPADLAKGLQGLIASGGGRGGSYGHTFNISSIGPKETAAAVKLALRMGRR
jgi:hypothetical protein